VGLGRAMPAPTRVGGYGSAFGLIVGWHVVLVMGGVI